MAFVTNVLILEPIVYFAVLVIKVVHKRIFYIRTNLRMLQYSNATCNIRMILCNKMMYFGDFVVLIACISSVFIFIT